MEIRRLAEALSPGEQAHRRLLESRQSSPPQAWSSSSSAPVLQRSLSSAPVFEAGDEHTPAVQQELAWYDHTVIWSRGTQAIRTFSFDARGEHVEKAAFVWFPASSSAPESSGTRRDIANATSYKGKAPAIASALASPFGPFASSHQSQWGGPRGGSTSKHGSSLRATRPELEQTLVIFFQSHAIIYNPSGETITTHLPFQVDGVWPLAEGGVVLQRALERREKKRWARRRKGQNFLEGMDPDRTSGSVLDELVDLDDEVESLPRLYTLSTPRGEARPIAQTPAFQGGYLSSMIKMTSPTRPLSPELSIILVSSRPYPLLVAIDHEAREIVFFRWARIPPATTATQTAAVRSPTLSPLQRMQSNLELPPAVPPKASSRPSMSRKRSSLGLPLGTDRRSSLLGTGSADPLDRSNRRSSIQRQPRQSGIPESRSVAGGMLQATLEPDDPFKAAAARPACSKRGPRGLSSGSILEADRRSSVGRLDLNKSMDRMALNAAEEADLRETTMMFGLERDDEGLASEIVTERIWAWPLTGQKDVDASEVQAFLSDTRSPYHALIHIHHTPRDHSPAILRTFRLKLDSQATAYSIEEVEAVECLSAVPTISTRNRIHDTLMLSSAGELQLQTSDCRIITISPPSGSRIIHLSDSVGSAFTATFDDGSRSRCTVDYRLRDDLALGCFEALSLFLPPQDFFNLKTELVARRATSWNAFNAVLEAVLGLSVESEVPMRSLDRLADQSKSSLDTLRRRLASLRLSSGTAMTRSRTLLECGQMSKDSQAASLLALHLLAEDCRLDNVREAQLFKLIPLIARLANALRRPQWTDHWMRLYPLSVTGIPPVHYDTGRDDIPLLDSFDTPPDIYTYIRRRITGRDAVYPLPDQLSKMSKAPGQWPELGEVQPLRLTASVANVYNVLSPGVSPHSRPVAGRASEAVLLMVASGLDEKWVDRLAVAVAIPIREAMKVCQASPQRDWPLDAYRFVGRSDQAIQSLALAGDEFQRNVETIGGTRQDIATLVQSVYIKKTEGGKESSEHVALPDIRFGADKRLKEVASMLQTNLTRTIAATEPVNADDAELLSFRINVANAIAHRTMAVAVGRAMFTYATKNAVITDAWVVPSIDLSIKLSPSNAVVKATTSAESVEWPSFHNGVASALSISPNSKGIDSSWIVFNKPTGLSASHGGFLMGLGLSGHLRCMQTWHAYPYLEPRHDPTTVGLLLGLASSFAGSQDSMITKVISLHTQALLPIGSVELSASPCIQSSALVALGLLYVGSRSHRMADAVLREVGRRRMPGVENFSEHQEVYSFSASMAVGLIMLGQGGQTSSQVERGIINRLRRCIVGDSSVGADQAHFSYEKIDTTYTAPGATLALGLMFLKSGRKDITDILDIPQNVFDLDHIRPDLLLVRTLSRALIQWDEITPNMTWIETQLPSCLRNAHKDHKKVSTMGLANELAYFNVIAGACFAVGLRYAGTATEFAHTTLMFFFGVFGKATANNTMSYEGKIRRTAARQGLNLITIALAMVMSGTGELNVLRRLRVSHGQEGAGVNYGTHMAMHMACGILFLGHGRHTLGSSNVAIAAMCIACFPRFSASPSDNKAYLQAYRHLWALAVEPRCLVARDVDTHDTIYLPVKVRVMEGQRVKSQHLIAPTLVAPFERLVSIEVDSPRYWPVTYDVLNNQRDRENLIRTGTIFVKRKAAFLDYNNDPKGNRSIFVRAGTMSGSDLFYDLVSPATPSAVSDEDFLALTSLHSGEPLVKTLGPILCRGLGSAFVQFAKFALLECISLDKWPVFFHYVAAFAVLRGTSTYRLGSAQVRVWAAKGGATSPALLLQLRLLQTYYSTAVFDRMYSQASTIVDKRSTLFRPAFLSVLVQELSADVTSHVSSSVNYFEILETPPRMLQTDLLDLTLSLASNNVPRLALLASLQQACNRLLDVYDGAEVERDDAFVLLLDRMRDTARKYDELEGGVNDAKETQKVARPRISIDNTPREWRMGSAEGALYAWIKAHDDRP